MQQHHGRAWRRCPRCKGSGSKERLGAVVLRVLLRRRGK